MEHVSINSVINIFKDLSFPDKEYALEILQKQLIEERRGLIARRIEEARANYKSGKVKRGTVKDLLKDLDSD